MLDEKKDFEKNMERLKQLKEEEFRLSKEKLKLTGIIDRIKKN